mgnify:CR=1 FL=1
MARNFTRFLFTRAHRRSRPGAIRTAAALVLALCNTNCSGPSCGPDDEPTSVGFTIDAARIDYQTFTAGANNDCPAPDAPAGVVSLSIHAQQTGSGRPLTLCIPRPDLLESNRVLDVATMVDVVDVSAIDAACVYTLAPGTTSGGSIQVEGMCDDGTHPDGFRLTMDLAVQVRRDCAGTITTESAMVTGSASVAAEVL